MAATSLSSSTIESQRGRDKLVNAATIAGQQAASLGKEGDEQPSLLHLLIFAFASSTTAILPPPNWLFRSLIRQQDVWCTFSGINFARDLVVLLVDSRTSLNLNLCPRNIGHPGWRFGNRSFTRVHVHSSAAAKGKDKPIVILAAKLWFSLPIQDIESANPLVYASHL
ncbi:hypothetical protein CPC08DRAFT_727117 [Agrocybe pediades]|nr:hypothetical protein CPC08DRAFT_727117 [Agrocybe pediades]